MPSLQERVGVSHRLLPAELCLSRIKHNHVVKGNEKAGDSSRCTLYREFQSCLEFCQLDVQKTFQSLEIVYISGHYTHKKTRASAR